MLCMPYSSSEFNGHVLQSFGEGNSMPEGAVVQCGQDSYSGAFLTWRAEMRLFS